MQSNNDIFNEQVNQKFASKVDKFFNKNNIATILNRANIRKTKGFMVKDIFYVLFTLPFFGKNLYHDVINNENVPYGKDVIYDFLKCENFNWRKFLLTLAVKIISFIDTLTSKKREKVLIVDDSKLTRSRSKLVELLSWVHDHTDNKYHKGFRFLALCWSDGNTFLPIDFAILAASSLKSRIQGIIKKLDKRSCGYKRRMEALTSAPDVLIAMVKRVLSLGIKANYILMDSWFAMPLIIAELRQYIQVVCMVKKTPKILYNFKGKSLTLEGIYRKIKKRPGKARILGSVIVEMKYGGLAKIVFVRNYRNKDWLAILTTDIELPDNEVVRIYGKRWDIEVFFKMSKQYLGLEKGVQTRDFDSQIAYTSIVMARYMFLALEQRRQSDQRTIGALFRACCEEMRDLSFMEALKRILELTVDKLRKAGEYSEQVYQELISAVFGTAIEFFGLNHKLCQRS